MCVCMSGSRLKVDQSDLISFRSSQPWPHLSVLLIMFTLDTSAGYFQSYSMSTDFKFFDPAERKTEKIKPAFLVATFSLPALYRTI